MGYKYAYQGPETVARAVARDLPISTKTAIMVANFVRGKSVTRARRDLQDILAERQAVPFTRFFEGAGHKPGIGPGKYPRKAAKEFLRLLDSVEANAKDRGFGSDLVLIGVTANRAARPAKYGRHRGRVNKATHVEMILAEQAEERKPKTKKAAKKPAKKAPAKKSAAKKSEKTADAKGKDSAASAPKKSSEKEDKKESSDDKEQKDSKADDQSADKEDNK